MFTAQTLALSIDQSQNITLSGTINMGSQITMASSVSSSSTITMNGGYGLSWNISNNIYNSGNNSPISIISSPGDGVWMGVYATSWSSTSDKTLKKNITSINKKEALSKILKLNPVKYNMIYDEDTIPLRQGLIAQEVQPYFPEIVSEISNEKFEGTKLGLAYTELIPYLISCIQDLQDQINELKK